MCDGHMKSLIKLIEPTPKISQISDCILQASDLSLDDFRIVVVVAVRVDSWKNSNSKYA
jgi:hypothetical protein